MTGNIWARRCKRILRDLVLPEPFEIDALCERIGADRGRPIRLCAIRFPVEGPGGLLLGTADTDYIFYDAQTTVAHQRHIIAHELGHLLLGHEHADPALGVAADGLPGATLLQHMFARTRYTQPEEWGAEFFATELLRRVSVWSADALPLAPDSESAELVRRLESSLSPRNRP
jgi:hypothetical protein